MKNQSGFTLLELLITIAIASILASIAIPAFNTTIDNSRLTSNSNALVGAVSLARSEAVNLGRNVSLSANGDGAWELRDVDNNNLLKTFKPNLQNITLSPAVLPTITFLPSGHRVFDSGVKIIDICDQRPVCREITIEISGSVSVRHHS